MKKTFEKLIFGLFLVIILFCFASCSHSHEFSMWSTTTQPQCTTDGMQSRVCNSCGFAEYSTIPALGHTEVVDSVVEATCISKGKTEGSHCSVCKATIKEQEVISAKGHTVVKDEAIAATCISDGKTEGTHCEVCDTIIVEQKTVASLGHQYDNGQVLVEATCLKNGTKKYVCTVDTCKHIKEESYSLPKYSATELFNQSVKYVGEIVTYDKFNQELALGTCFVISSDGKIVTNYHVIEGAYSAEITINGKTYNVDKVLAYDSNIDLAVLKVNATGLTPAIICKNAVKTGETIYAIGSSRGLTNTYSQGIITYADRVVDNVSHIQHDASITHGNSGGPLINVYGEVIGINTWGLSDSQNLNFAVFTSELDNLIYGTPLTMEEFYEKECDVYEKIKNYIIDNGVYSEEYDWYYIVLDVDYSADYTKKYERRAYYYINDDEITFDFIINDGDNWVYFVVDEDLDGEYYWSYFDVNDYEMSGIIYAADYDSNTLLGYNSNNIPTSSLRSTIRELASIMIDGLCYEFENDFSEIGVTAKDIGFYQY